MTGLEAAVGTAAQKGVSRLLTGIFHNTLKRRKARKATGMVDLFKSADMPTLTPPQADGVKRYVSSKDFEIVATQIAITKFLDMLSQPSPISSFSITASLREGLRSEANIEGAELRAIVEALELRLTVAITSSLRDIDLDRLPAAVLAKLVFVAADQAAAATRSSELLSTMKDLSAIHIFERDLRTQILALQGKMRVPNAGMLKSVSYDELYVEPRLSVTTEQGPTEKQDPRVIPAADLVDHFGRAVVLGHPGGGKSTLAAKTIYDFAASDVDTPLPFLLILREYIAKFQSKRTTFTEYLTDLCRSPYQVNPPSGAIEYMLCAGRALVIFDGLDELTDTSLRRQVVEAIEGFAHRYPNIPIITTSRRVGYEEAPLNNALFPVAQLEEFSESQVNEYASKWFEIDQRESGDSRSKLTSSFMRDSALVKDLRVNPLMLSLMCGMYSAEGYIPANRPDVYEKCTLLLFERWDRQRGIISPLPYNSHIRYAIQALAWWLYTEPTNQVELTRPKLLKFMTDYLNKERFSDRGDAENAAESFIEFCTGRAWVLNKFGSSGGVEHFGFTHQTFLEYFSAIQMVRKFPVASRLYAELEVHLRTSEWEVVAQLALQILNRNVENGANDFLDILLKSARDSELKQRSNLLSFAARMLGFVVPNPKVLEHIVLAIMTFAIDMPSPDGRSCERRAVCHSELSYYDIPMLLLAHCGNEVRKDVGMAVLKAIDAALDTMPVKYNTLIICEEFARFFGELLVDPAVNEYSLNVLAKYKSIIDAQPFVWHDVVSVVHGDLDIAEFINKHGPSALYTQLTYAPDSTHWVTLVSVVHFLSRYNFDAADSKDYPRVKRMCQQLMVILPEVDRPWVSDVEILGSAPMSFQWSIPTDAKCFGALLLLSLPYAEASHSDDLRRPPLLADVPRILGMCNRARASQYSASAVMTELISHNLPSAIVPFMKDWLSRRITLVR